MGDSWFSEGEHWTSIEFVYEMKQNIYWTSIEILDFISGIPVNILRITDVGIVHTSLIIRWKIEKDALFLFFNVKRKMKEV